jgi:hypothetical protein
MMQSKRNRRRYFCHRLTFRMRLPFGLYYKQLSKNIPRWLMEYSCFGLFNFSKLVPRGTRRFSYTNFSR